MSLNLLIGKNNSLANYVARQLNNIVPAEGVESDERLLLPFINPALLRIHPILNSVRAFNPSEFNHFNSLQYATFLYLLANQCWQEEGENELSDRLFCLNRALNSIDLFYSVKMPEIFFISHGLGTVLGAASYGERCVFFQNVTVGRVGERRPSIGSEVVIYPGAMVTGDSIIGDGCVIAAGSIINNKVIPKNMMVRMHEGKLLIAEKKFEYIDLYYRDFIFKAICS